MGLNIKWLKQVCHFTQRSAIVILVGSVSILVGAEAWCAARNARAADSIIYRSILQDLGINGSDILTVAKNNRGFEKKYQEWQSLTPQEKDTMRHRMNQLNQMPPQDRQHFQRLFDKWQQLSPSERRQIERALDNWDSLSSNEKESIRKRFK